MENAQPIVVLPSQLCTELLWAPQRVHWPSAQVMVQRNHDTMAGMAQSVFDAAPAQFVLVAHGMGGFVAFEMMRRQPERIIKLVLMSTLAPADTPKQTVRREGYLRLVEQGQFDRIIDERIPMLVHESRTGDTALTAILRQMAKDTGPDAFQRQQRAIMARPDSRPTLAQIGCPTLILYGEADGMSAMEHQQEMQKSIPNASLHVLKMCGHMMTLEQPEAVNALLRGFLAA